MKVSFWSTMHGQSGITSNLIATGVGISAEYRLKVAFLQSHLKYNNLAMALMGTVSEMDLFTDTGLDALIRDIKSKPLSKEIIFEESISLMKTGTPISLFLGTMKQNKEVFKNEMNTAFLPIIDEINRCHDITFIDVDSGYHALSFQTMDSSDLVIINFSQNRTLLEHYFKRPINNPNVIYLFGNYNPKSKYNIRNLEKMYPALKRRSIVIPYNVNFMDAQNDGKAIEFMIKNIDCKRDNDNYSFIKGVKEAAAAIYKAGGFNECIY